jgi:pimeloyl-ACP methyl ester carboxylesterase
MIRVLVEAGLEVWSGSMRRQRGSRRLERRAGLPGLQAFAAVDVPVLIEAVRQRSATQASRVDLIGSSLGGSVAYAHLALCPDTPVGALIALGAPLQWDHVHPALRVLFASERLAGMVPMTGTDKVARRLFPLLARFPKLLSIYMNLDHVDLEDARELTQGVDEPDRRVNRDLVRWMRQGTMVFDGVDVSAALAQEWRPLMVVLANRDGIVPRDSATPALDLWGGSDTTLLEVGTPDDWYAHADLFIAPEAPELVFEPMAAWLQERQRG